LVAITANYDTEIYDETVDNEIYNDENMMVGSRVVLSLPMGVFVGTASRKGCVFLFFGRYGYFHDFGPKIML